MNKRSTLEWAAGAAGPLLAAEDQAEPHWSDLGLCAEVGGDLWFPPKGGSTREAKAICRRCPSVVPCLEYALANDEKFGIWGAKSERERRRIKRSRARSGRDGLGEAA